MVVVTSSKASGARGSSSGGGVKSLWAGVAGSGGRLIGVEALWACLATIGGGCVFVQAGCARGTGAVIDGGSSEGRSDAGVEAPPRSFVLLQFTNFIGCCKTVHVAVSSYSWRSSDVRFFDVLSQP